MKRFFKYILLLIIIIIPISFVKAEETTNKEKVLLYVFYGENCDWCEELHAYLDELALDNEYNYMYKLVDLEVWNDADNNNLMAKVADYFDYSLKGVPYIVCGDSFITGFNKEKTPDQIKKLIKDAYLDEDYVDVVSKVDDGTLAAKQEQEEQEAATQTENQSKRIGLILTGVCAIIIVAIIFGRTGESYLEEENVALDVEKEEENIKKEIKEEAKETKKEIKEEVKETKKETKKEPSNEPNKIKNKDKNSNNKITNKKKNTTKKNNSKANNQKNRKK